MNRIACTAAGALLLATGCAHRGPAPKQATPAPAATLLIESKGVTMPLALARGTLVFRPVIPAGRIVQTAVIPPLNVDEQRKHGIAIEYAAGGSVWLLSQWPASQAAAPEMRRSPCAPARYKANGLLWTTQSGLVMTLEPDGSPAGAGVDAAARPIMTESGCGRGR